MSLFVIGSSNMDLVIFVPHIPKIGETVIGGKSDMVFGGKGANQAVAAARAGGKVSFITKLGRDPYGEKMKIHYQNEKLPMDFILADENEPTGIAQIMVSEKGENSIAVASGANMNLNISDIRKFENQINKAGILLLQLEIPLKTVEYIAELAFKNQIRLILNPAPAQLLSNKLLEKIWLLTPNETEAEILTGIKVTDVSSAKKASKVLLNKGVKNVIVTLGENGCLFCSEEHFVHYQANKVKAVDTTAAGDVFNGFLAAALAENKSFDEAIQIATAAASVSVTRKGAQPSIPFISELSNYTKS